MWYYYGGGGFSWEEVLLLIVIAAACWPLAVGWLALKGIAALWKSENLSNTAKWVITVMLIGIVAVLAIFGLIIRLREDPNTTILQLLVFFGLIAVAAILNKKE